MEDKTQTTENQEMENVNTTETNFDLEDSVVESITSAVDVAVDGDADGGFPGTQNADADENGKETLEGDAASDDVDDDDESNDEEEQEESTAVDEGLIERAVKAGLSLKDAQSFSDQSALERTVSLLESKSTDAADAEEDAEHEESNEDDESEEAIDPLADIPELDPEDYDPELAKMFNGMRKMVQEQSKVIKQMQESHLQKQEQLQQEEVKKATDWFDSQIKSLPQDYHEVLGNKTFSELDNKSPEFANRAKLAKRIELLTSGYKAIGEEVPSREALFNEALDQVFADTKSQLQKRKSTHTNRPSRTRERGTKDPEVEIAEIIDNKYFK